MNNLICVSGEIASGKSTFARALSENIPDSEIRSFGDVVRGVAAKQQRSVNRNSLQEIGMELIAAGWSSFVNKLLEGVSENSTTLIVDGIRHVAALEELRSRAVGRKVLTVFVEAPDDVLEERLAQRSESLSSREHTVESELKLVKSLADISISGIDDLQDNVKQVTDFLEKDD